MYALGLRTIQCVHCKVLSNFLTRRECLAQQTINVTRRTILYSGIKGKVSPRTGHEDPEME
jgi:hypothetical protein